jgi:hypothetical protein
MIEGNCKLVIADNTGKITIWTSFNENYRLITALKYDIRESCWSLTFDEKENILQALGTDLISWKI